MTKLVFGPVPSRRLGRSLGVNNIPPKHCSYSCIYCQVGKTAHLEVERREFYPPEDLVREIEEALSRLRGGLDYVTFVPDGEPTLDRNLGKTIRMLKSRLDVRVAVITNASLLHLPDVRADLGEADLVSVKVDAVTERVWRLVNRPHPAISNNLRLDGIIRFSEEFSGTLISETMLVSGFNDSAQEFELIGDFLARLNLHKAYIAVPIRPPAERFVRPPSEETLIEAHEILTSILGENKVELLMGYEGPQFSASGDPVESLLATTSVHPMRLDYAESYLRRYGLDPREVLSRLQGDGHIAIVEYLGRQFVVRRTLRSRDSVSR